MFSTISAASGLDGSVNWAATANSIASLCLPNWLANIDQKYKYDYNAYL